MEKREDTVGDVQAETSKSKERKLTKECHETRSYGKVLKLDLVKMRIMKILGSSSDK